MPLVDGISLEELDDRLAKWISIHSGNLMLSSYHAINLQSDFSRASTHILRVLVEPRSDHGGKAAKYFRVKQATVPSYSEAFTYPSPWPGGVLQLQRFREESEREGRGTVAAAAIECYPLDVQLVPFGSLFAHDFIDRSKRINNWEEVLKRNVEAGKRLGR